MQSTVTAAGPCRKTLKITITPEQIQRHIDQVYEQASLQVRQKGFRHGKVPRRILEQRHGPAILAEAKETLIHRCFEDALREHQLAVIGRPQVEGIDDQPLDPDRPIEFSVHVDVRPEIQLGQVRGLEIRREPDAVTDQDLRSALEQIAGQKRTLQPVAEPVAEGDFARGELRYKDASGAIVHRRAGAQLNPRIPVAGTDPEAFAAKMIGAAQGTTIEVPLTFPPNFDKAELRGQTGSVEFAVEQVLRVTSPAIDDEFAKGLGFEGLAALEADLRQRLGAEKRRLEQRRQEGEAIRILLDETGFDVPPAMVESETESSLAEFAKRMQENGTAEAEIEQRVAAARDEAKADAERRVRTFFLLDAIARREKLFVTEGDVEAEFRAVAAQNDTTPDQVREYYRENELLGDLRLALMERKVREFLRENAKLTDN